MILHDHGFVTARLSPELASLLGDGSRLLAEAVTTSCGQIEPVHVLAFLARSGGSLLRLDYLEPHEIDPDLFCRQLYETALSSDRAPGMPTVFGKQAMSAAALRMWEAFDDAISPDGSGGERLLVRVVVDHESVGRALLAAIAGSPEDFERFMQRLDGDDKPRVRLEPFGPSGAVNLDVFGPSGRRVLKVLGEDTAALGANRVTALHLLYALIGIKAGVLARAIFGQGVDPVREVHGHLSRELTRPGARRVAEPELSKESMYPSVAQAFEAAARDATREGCPIGERHLARAAIVPQQTMVCSWLAARKIRLESLRDYLGQLDAEEATEPDARLSPLNEIESALEDRILGQRHAIRVIVPWIKRLRFNFPRERGPAAVLLFLGPSGTGKTQLAKELARAVYGSDEQLIMLEMGQFASKESINMFIGSPPGYVGYGEGKLTNGLRDQAPGVVLFDEIEKAHEDVWVALLRFLDEGLINDPAGPTRDGRGCVVVLTSNLAADSFAETISGDGELVEPNQRTEELIRREVLKYLKRPEIYNRVDEKVVFRPFSDETYTRLVRRQLETEIAKFAERGTEVRVEPMVVGMLTEQAVQANLEGARCVPRLVNRHVVAPVIDILTREEGPRIATVVVSRKGDSTLVEQVGR